MKTIELTIDDRQVAVEEGTSVFDAARMNGISIPVLCHAQNERPIGVCRVCTVDCGDKVLQASCVRPAENGMKVYTASDKVKKHRRMILELLMSDHPSPCARQRVSGDCELETQAAAEGIVTPRFSKHVSRRGQDDSSLVISVDHEACILCDRCIRGCDEIRHNDVLGRRGKGYNAGIAFDLNRPMGTSSCVSCGECMVSCPTGALTNKSVIRTVLPGGDPVGVDELKQLPFFQKVSGTFLDLNKNAVIKRRFRAGDIICREGDYGSTAFYILEGKVEVYLQSMMKQKPGHAEGPGVIDRLARVFSPRRKPASATNNGTIPMDSVIDLTREKPVAELGEGDIFGEMTCMSLYPRSATVRAKTDCVMLEMLRNVLDVIQRNKTLRAELEKNYRKRALEDHLRTVPMFSGLSAEFIDHLARSVWNWCAIRTARFCAGRATGHSISSSSASASSRWWKSTPAATLCSRIRAKGGFFGEIGLLTRGTYAFTVTALDNVEVVRIAAEEFREMLERFPISPTSLRTQAREREEHNKRHSAAVAAVSLDSFLKQGLMESNSLLVIDLEKCTRCDNCVKACSEAHDGVTRLVREGLRFDKFLMPTSCRHCRDPLCMIGCPVGSIRRRNSLETVIEDWCVGCGLCARNCPFGNITMTDLPDSGAQKASVTKRKATACDLCADLPEPSCVYACPHDAAHRVEPNQFFRSLISAAADDNIFVTPEDVEGRRH
jgi:Fe-S-cluster-containing hydrogenase component 2/CRP-like cAMP-binding protein